VLEAFGVDETAEAVYLAMLQHPDAPPAQLAALLGLDGHRLRTAYDDLAELSLLRPSWQDPTTVRPVSPEVALEPLIAHQRAELADRQLRMEKSQAALAVLVAERASQRTHPAADLEEVLGIDSIRERLEQLTIGTRHEVLALSPGGAQSSHSRTASRPLDQALLERGVTMRTVYLDSVRNDTATTAYARWLAERGGQVRTASTLPLRMIIIDRETAVVPIDTDLTQAGVTVMRGSGAIAAMHALFEQVWATATPLGTPAPRDEYGLTGPKRALLHLLAHGLSDEAAARKLGVSDRTIRRFIVEFMDHLGARSRFQAGVLAHQYGWTHTDDPQAPAGVPCSR
jgi:sugar-specific transcriptional regulator TrmB